MCRRRTNGGHRIFQLSTCKTSIRSLSRICRFQEMGGELLTSLRKETQKGGRSQRSTLRPHGSLMKYRHFT
jgi:hypothetical protein